MLVLKEHDEDFKDGNLLPYMPVQVSEEVFEVVDLDVANSSHCP